MKLLKTILAIAVFTALSFTISTAAEGPTYFTSISGTAQVNSHDLLGSAGATYTFGTQIPIRDNRYLLLGYRSIQLAGNASPQSLNLGFVDYYELGKDWDMGVWLASDVRLADGDAETDEDAMSGMLGFSVQKSITDKLAAELYNVFTLRGGDDYTTFGLILKVTPKVR